MEITVVDGIQTAKKLNLKSTLVDYPLELNVTTSVFKNWGRY